MATPGILFSGSPSDTGLQIESLKPTVTIEPKNGVPKMLKITIPIDNATFLSDKPGALPESQAFIPLTGTDKKMDITPDSGVITFLQDGKTGITFGMTSEGGKVGGPGIVPSPANNKKKSDKPVSKKKTDKK